MLEQRKTNPSVCSRSLIDQTNLLHSTVRRVDFIQRATADANGFVDSQTCHAVIQRYSDILAQYKF